MTPTGKPMEVKFYLRNELDAKGQPRIREYFDCAVPRPDGKYEHIIGMVDDGFRAANKKEADALSRYIAEWNSHITQYMKAHPNETVYLDYEDQNKRPEFLQEQPTILEGDAQ